MHEQYKQSEKGIFVLQVYWRTKTSMAVSSSSVDDEKGHLTQLEKKIAQLAEIISKLRIPSTQTQATTPVAKLPPTFGDENPPSTRMSNQKVWKSLFNCLKLKLKSRSLYMTRLLCRKARYLARPVRNLLYYLWILVYPKDNFCSS